MEYNITEDLFSELWTDKQSLFKFLTDDEKDFLKNNTTVFNYNKGDIIFNAGEKPVGFLCLVRGKVKIFKEGVSGREQIVRMSKPISFICYRAVFAKQLHHAGAMALEDSIVFMFPEEVMLELIKRNFDLNMAFLNSFAIELGVSYYRTVSLTQKHIRGRLAESLLFLKNTYGFEANGITLKVYLSREDIANLSNMNISNAIRTLSAFASEKIISIDGKKINLLNIPELEKINEMQ